MAEEVKKIITVEVGKSITSVRDFKKHIEDLRGALLGLNEESEEYKTISEQIATDQAKLNEVMSVGKNNTDSAAGSYNELNNQLKALRQQYKALSETERNGTTGQAILQNITKLDTELKDIDESMGQYYRNVGNYKGAFEEAFKAMAQNIGNVNPELGKLMKTAASLIPLIKKASTAATTGLKGIKAGIASTGIGLLVVALGEIVAHWEEISNWVSKVIGKQKDLTAETRETARAVGEISQAVSDYYRNVGDLLSASGLDSKQVNTTLQSINATETRINDLRIKQLESWKRTFQGIQENFKRARRSLDSTKEWDVIYEFNDKVDQFNQSIEQFDEIFTKGLEGEAHAAEVREKSLEEMIKAPSIGKGSKAFDETINKIDEFIGAYRDRANDLKNIQKGLREEQDKIDARAQASAIDRANEAANVFKSEEQLRTERYEKDVAEAKQYIKDEQNLNNALINLELEYQHDIKEIRKKQWESSDAYKNLEQAKSDAKNLYDSLKDYGKIELQLLDENYKKQKKLLEDFGYDTTNLTKKYQEDRKALIEKDTQEGLDKLKEADEEALRVKREGLQKLLDAQQRGEFLDSSAASTMWTINTKTHETEEGLEYQKSDRLYEIAEKGYQDRIELYQKYLSNLKKDSDEYLEISREMHDEEMELAQLQYDYQVELEDRLLEKKRKNLQIMQGMFQAYGELGATVAGLIADASEEGTARWKAARITETVINTISGAAGAFMQGMSSYPQPWGAIIGAAGAAVATATGAAQIAKIKSTQIGTSSVSGISANSSGVGVEPLLNPDYDLQRITNLSLQSDEFLPGKTQVYVLESDIQEVGNRVQVRENNATF